MLLLDVLCYQKPVHSKLKTVPTIISTPISDDRDKKSIKKNLRCVYYTW